MQLIQGACHCRNITYDLEWPLDDVLLPVRACGCSFCRKHVAEYTSHPEASLSATVAEPSLLTRYRFGTETADFFVCARCGVVPLVTSLVAGVLYGVVNVNSFADLMRFRFMTTITDFEGEDLNARLERRRRTWIPNVVVSGSSAPRAE